jgi:hypothetical protein
MILNPSVLALLVSSLLISFMVLYSAVYGAQILRRWNIASGSELQLALERKTYLISTILSYFLGIQIISLFLFVFTVDSLCPLFVGAMCAVGTLTVNGFGYPTLILKLVNFLLAGLWLIINHADNSGYDYPLIRKKYAFLMVLTPLILAESALEIAYFLEMKPDIITSCCGSLFSPASRGIAAEIAAAPSIPMKFAFYAATGLTLITGTRFILKGWAGYLFALLSGATFLVSLVALISFISLYIYEMPSHHCPFCILQKEYHYLGYPLYVTLLLGSVTGMGVGVLMPFRSRPSLAATLPGFQRRLALTSVISWLLFTLLATWPIVFSSFRLEGY